MNWPYWIDEESGISGKFKSEPEDFVVEEIPLYLPCGDGEHLYIRIEKAGLATDQVVQQLAQNLRIKVRDIGYAGKKDRFGVTRQWLSLWNIQKSQIEKLEIPGLRVLETAFHRNKLHQGHLAGNRFEIILKHVDQGAGQKVNEIFRHLEHAGVPNYYGPQRFGRRGDNAAIGAAILQKNWNEAFHLILGRPRTFEAGNQIGLARKLFEEGNYREAHKAWPDDEFSARRMLRLLMDADGDFVKAGPQMPKNIVRFYLNAMQSFWFNASLAKRLPEMIRIWQGDLAYLHRNGAVFRVEEPAKEQSRLDRFEISPSGPIWGEKMILPQNSEKELEFDILEESGRPYDQLRVLLHNFRLRGQRRPYRVPLGNPACEQRDSALRLQFELPGGSYATSVVREILKENLPETEIMRPVFTTN
jgi:tRNA pseudouridine13 synthase